jgi:hypothetical protein
MTKSRTRNEAGRAHGGTRFVYPCRLWSHLE